MSVFKKNILFTKTPLKGEYQFKDYFKLYPLVSDKAPNNAVAAHFPCILKLTYDEKEVKDIKPFGLKHVDKMIAETAAQTNKLIEIANLLLSITNFHFFFYRNVETNWAVPFKSAE